MQTIEPVNAVGRKIQATTVVLALMASGCARVNTEPFSQFKTGLESLRAGVQAQATTDVENARARLLERAKADNFDVAALRLTFPEGPDPYASTYSFPDPSDEPLVVSLEGFQRGMYSLNSAMIGYAELLLRLAGNETIDPTRFDQLTKDVNGNAVSAASALGLKLPSKETALLSTAAIAIFRGIVERKRRKELHKAIDEVQPQVVAYSEAMRTATELLATGVTANYTTEIVPLLSKREVAKALDLNQATQLTLQTLSALSASYAKLPEAHSDLSKAVGEKPGVLTGIIDFTNEALRLNALSNELAQANEAAGASQ